MGIWQLHALSNILNCKLMSIYPQRGGATVRRHLHRWITPFPKPSPFQWSQMAIMWTSTQGKDQEAKDWRVNHFVVCVHTWHTLWADFCPLIDSWIFRRGIQTSMTEAICFDYLVCINGCCSVCTVDNMKTTHTCSSTQTLNLCCYWFVRGKHNAGFCVCVCVLN